MPRPRIKYKWISKEKWARTPKDYKGISSGVRTGFPKGTKSILVLTKRGTTLQPVKIRGVDDKKRKR